MGANVAIAAKADISYVDSQDLTIMAMIPDVSTKVNTSRQVATQHSLTGGGDLSANRTLSLVNDSASPGNNKVYGTDGSGNRGWKNDPAGGPGASATTVEVDLGSAAFEGKFTITDAGISASSKIMCWQAPGPYTGKGTRADEASMQPVIVTSVEPGSGSAVVRWMTPPFVAMVNDRPGGNRDTPSTVVGFDPRYPYIPSYPKRIGRVKGNVKFTYVIFS